MGFLKRISKIVTPPIKSKSQNAESFSDSISRTDKENHSEVREGGGAVRIGDILANLLSDPGDSSHNLHDELSELKDIASKYGSYITATEIRDCVLRMPKKSEEDWTYRKGRGYELAADLFKQSLLKKLKPVESGILTVPSEEFAANCKELLECYFLAEKHRKGIQVCLLICEDLIMRSCGPSEAARQYPSLARESLKAILELTLEEKLQADRKYNRAKRQHRKFDTPMPEDNSSAPSVDDDLATFLGELREKVQSIDEALSSSKARPEVEFSQLKGNEEEEVLTRLLAYTESVRTIAKNTHYLPLHALAYEQAAQVKESLARGSGADYFKGAALVFEKEAEKETGLSLTLLSRTHYERAAQLWNLAGDGAQANNAKAKASSMPRE